MTSDLRALFNWFDANRNDLAKKYSGKFALLHENQVHGAFESESDAYDQGVIRFGLGNFLVQKCEANPEIQFFHSRVSFD